MSAESTALTVTDLSPPFENGLVTVPPSPLPVGARAALDSITGLSPPGPPGGPETAPERGERPHVKRIGIVGFTASRAEAPWDDPEWELWGLNNLHTGADVDTSKFGAWFDLHDFDTITADEVHTRWLEAGADGLPVFVWEPDPRWPTATRFPKAELLAGFPNYFTNSVSWMTAFAIEVLKDRCDRNGWFLSDCELGVWGIDMAQGGGHGNEYSSQRPSCEMFLGMAMGLGIGVTIAPTSDLLRSGALYGEEPTPMLRKIRSMAAQLREQHDGFQKRHNELSHELRVCEANLNATSGGLNVTGYLDGVWFPPESKGSTH